jgi:hypothetical protein
MSHGRGESDYESGFAPQNSFVASTGVHRRPSNGRGHPDNWILQYYQPLKR